MPRTARLRLRHACRGATARPPCFCASEANLPHTARSRKPPCESGIARDCMNRTIYDVAIVGAGPNGLTAAAVCALFGPIPWRAPECRGAAVVHLGGTFEEIARSEAAAADGRIAEAPFVLIAQQSAFDSSRAPSGRHTGWAYCHVPHGSSVDMTARIERQIERFAPGFSDLILARRAMSPADIEAHNPNMIGGDIGGGSNGLPQFLARPVPRWNPYRTSNPRLFLCSSSTPPGGGVHGMCGYWAARTALRSVFRSDVSAELRV